MESQAWNSSASGNGRNMGVTLIAGEEGERRGPNARPGFYPKIRHCGDLEWPEYSNPPVQWPRPCGIQWSPMAAR
jgi:hypothetical protein